MLALPLGEHLLYTIVCWMGEGSCSCDIRVLGKAKRRILPLTLGARLASSIMEKSPLERERGERGIGGIGRGGGMGCVEPFKDSMTKLLG